MNVIWRVYLAFSWLGLALADWHSHAFLQNAVDDPIHSNGGKEKSLQKRIVVEDNWVPREFADEISKFRIPGGHDLPGSLQEEESEEDDDGPRGEDEREEEEDEDEEEEAHEDDDRDQDENEDDRRGGRGNRESGEDEEEEEEGALNHGSHDTDDRDYEGEPPPDHHFYQQDKKRPYVVNYEVTETIPYDTKKPRPKGPVYPQPPPCPGAQPPTFPPPPTNPPKPSKAPPKDPFFPESYDSYFPTSYASVSKNPRKGALGWGRLQSRLGPFGSAAQHEVVQLRPQVGQTGPQGLQLQPPPFVRPGQHHMQPVFSPQTNNPRIVPAPQRLPRRASPQRVIVRYHRPAYVIRKIQQIGPGADTLIIRRPQPRLKEVHIHHHHDPGPVIHVHKDDESDFLEDAKFEADVAGQKAVSEAELEAAGHFAEPGLKTTKIQATLDDTETHIHTS